MAITAKSRDFSPFSLDAVNFLAADVRGAVGPYLNVFLVTQQHWSQSEVGLVTTVAGLLGIAVQTPIGAAIDENPCETGRYRYSPLPVLAIIATVIFAWPAFWPVAIANSLMSIAGDVFGPAVAALTLGLRCASNWQGRMGPQLGVRPCRQRRDRAGGRRDRVTYFLQRAVFLLVPAFAALTMIAVLSIPADAIDYNQSRDLEAGADKAPAGYSALFKSKPLVIFGVCVMLFHLANAGAAAAGGTEAGSRIP